VINQPRNPKLTRTRKISRLWPKIKKLAEKGTQPQDIATILNKGLELKDQLNGKQVSDKIRRMKTQGQIALNVAKTSGRLEAEEGDSVWQRTASRIANRNEPEIDLDDSEEMDGSDRFGRDFLRFRTHSTSKHFFLIAEACVDRAWASKVSDEDDSTVELTVTLKAPNFEVLDQLFPGHRLDFGFEEDDEEKHTFLLDAGAKLRRQAPVATYSPNEKTPLWYGFQFDHADELTQTNARNVDFAKSLIGEKKRPREDGQVAGNAASV